MYIDSLRDRITKALLKSIIKGYFKKFPEDQPWDITVYPELAYIHHNNLEMSMIYLFQFISLMLIYLSEYPLDLVSVHI